MCKILFIISLLSTNILAEESSKADILLKKMKTSPEEIQSQVMQIQKAQKFQVDDLSKVKITDAYLAMLFTEWKSSDSLTKKSKEWILQILEQNFEKSLKELADVSPEFSLQDNSILAATELYLLYKLDLSQSFFDLWLESTNDQTIAESKPFLMLDQTIGLEASKWFYKNAVFISEINKQKIINLDGSKSLFTSTAKLWALVRDGQKALPYLKGLPKGHELILPISNTVILSLAREKRLGEAGQIMKQVVEPEVMRSGDPRVLSRYYLLLGRLLYQAEAYSAAEEFYRKIPNSVPEYIQARVEMAWLLLRRNDHINLRGEIASLDQKLFEDNFLPELHLLKSISDLKKCHFNDVKLSFNNFVQSSKRWTKKFKENLKPGVLAPVDTYDLHISLMNKGLKRLSIEDKKLRQLFESSHKYISHINNVNSFAQKQVESEHHRYWKNRELLLAKTIRKMRFVKIEMLSRLAIAKKSYEKNLKKELALKGNNEKALEIGERKKENQIVFPYDGVMWPDELFRLQSALADFCPKG